MGLEKNLVSAFLESVNSNTEKPVVSQLTKSFDSNKKRNSLVITNKELANKAISLASFLKKADFKKGDKVAIISNTRPEWLIADLAILMLGGVVVSVYQTLTPNEIAYILYDSDSKIIFIENSEQYDKVDKILNNKISIPKVEAREEQEVKLEFKKIISFENVNSDKVDFINCIFDQADIKDFKIEDVKENDLASIVYTSGTTGAPKGVPQTHKNHLSNIRQVGELDLLENSPSLFLFLPLAHSFAKLMAYIGLIRDVTLIFPAIEDSQSSKFDPKNLSLDIRDANSNIIPIVPRILEKVEEAIKQKAKNKGFAAKLLNLTLKSSQNLSCPWNKLIFLLLTPIRKKIKQGIFGKNFRCAVSGGAKLSSSTNQFFENLGITILQGYGLTETCVATNVNRLANNKIGTVGQVIASDIEIKITEEKEILFRGPNVTSGYYNRPQATSESWDDQGWFHTGDLGVIDSQGFLKIIGRKKEILVSSYGKKISPVDIEDQLKNSVYITNALLVGDGKPFCVALICLDKINLEKWISDNKFEIKDLANDARVKDLISKDIAKINKNLANYEEIKRFKLLVDDFTQENGLLTPTFKVKRNIVEEVYKQEIIELYQKSSNES